MSDEMEPDLAYYADVAKTQTNPEILKVELLDLIKEVAEMNTRLDSKPEYKWSTPAEWRASIGSVDFNMDIFWQAARELKE